MKVLVGCEFTGAVRDAFSKAGHESMSCDTLESETKGHHYRGDIVELLQHCIDKDCRFDLIILHPPCTAMSVCGNKKYAKGKPDYIQRLKSIRWTLNLWNMAKKVSDRVALENPASVIFPYLKRAGAKIQYVQPFKIGHLEQKKQVSRCIICHRLLKQTMFTKK